MEANRPLSVSVARVRPGAQLPQRMSAQASGWDLAACIEAPVHLAPGRWALVPTGIALEIPEGTEGQVRPRSGLAARHGIGIVNAPGTIDSDYRGEVCVILMNWGSEDFVVNDGDRIAQIVFARVEPVRMEWSSAIAESDRGGGGFGHTGIGSKPGRPV